MSGRTGGREHAIGVIDRVDLCDSVDLEIRFQCESMSL